MQTVKSTCPYCGVGCGVSIETTSSSKTLVLGDQDHPANYGRLCSKGSALGETLLDAKQGNRLTQPMINGQAASWSDATQTIADKIASSIKEHGRDSVAFYLSGQLLTEDYYVANKLMKGFIGSANVDTNSRLCMASAVVGYKRAFGTDTVPCNYEDLDAAELIVLIGSNAAWTHPILYQRMVAAKQANPNLKVVLIDPRKTATHDIADLHLPIKSSSDGFLFQALLKYLIDTESTDEVYIQNHTDGFDELRALLSSLDLAEVADAVSVDQNDLVAFFEWFAETKNVISFYSQGINQSATGTDKCNAIINCHLATGKIGYQGAGPFSITGQPNAMGGREVGGLANQLAAHMDFAAEDCDRVQRFWKSPTIATQAGLKAVDLFDAVADGQIKVIWVMATNPAVSLPDSNKVRKALELCPTVIVSDITHTDTSAYANILLPAQGWSEKDGTVTNSERRISRQRQFKEPVGEAKADWWALSEVANKLGYEEHFNYRDAHQVFVEHCQLSGFENDGSRAFDISGLSDVNRSDYDSLKPIQWPVNKGNQQGSERMFTDGKFFTANGRAKFINSHAKLADCVVMPNDSAKPNSFTLNSGRVRDQWHTMTRTGQAPSLTGHIDVPIVQINPSDAETHQLKENQMVKVSSKYGDFIAAAKVTDDVRAGDLFSAIHWTEQFATNSVITSVIDPTVDPFSGQPELKASTVTIAAYHCKYWARVASTKAIKNEGFEYWAQSKTKRGYVSLLGSNEFIDWRQWSEGESDDGVHFTQYSNDKLGAQTLLGVAKDSIELLVYAQERAEYLPSFAWLSVAFDSNDSRATASLLRSESDEHDQRICSCFGVSKKAIQSKVDEGVQSIEELGLSLGCGSKCGSCKPELSEILKARAINPKPLH